MDFVKEKLKEYKVDEIRIYLDNEEQFVYMNPDLPLRYWSDLSDNLVKRAHLGEKISTIENMGNGQMIRRGVSFNIAEAGDLLVVIGIFLPQNYAQKINNITANVQRYQQIKVQKDPVKTFYLLTLIFFTLLIVFAASWIGLRLAKSISVPIEKLADATKEVSKGNLDVRVEDPASDEIGIFIESFNQMISDLKASQLHIAQKTSELETRKQYIETIQNNITTGIVTLDAESNITTINPSAQSMLGLNKKELVGKNYQEVLNQPRYTEIVKQIRKGMQNKYQITEKEIKIRLDNQTRHAGPDIVAAPRSQNNFSGLILVLDDLIAADPGPEDRGLERSGSAGSARD